LELIIMRVWRYTWRLYWSGFGDAIAGHDHANLEAIIVEDWRYTNKQESSECGDALGDHDGAN
jgi:hypothetical protein